MLAKKIPCNQINHFLDSIFKYFPSWAEGGPGGADWGEAHLNDVRFNSKLVFFTNNDCLKVDIQFQRSLKIPKFGLTEFLTYSQKKFLSRKLYWNILLKPPSVVFFCLLKAREYATTTEWPIWISIPGNASSMKSKMMPVCD